MKTKKELRELEAFENKNLNNAIGGLTADEATATEARKKGGTKGTSTATGWSYTDDKDGSNIVWSA
jgi:hypothetical protein